ncbi:BAI1-associated protein 3 isoform X2 [Parasteatoda tepidariorum]|uniref:BAI1-associated protein 3 isoform X2 n=1 Tax=Parasteatoda tepidariorum TaxID=114398 RepID=UPI0039BCDB1E
MKSSRNMNSCIENCKTCFSCLQKQESEKSEENEEKEENEDPDDLPTVEVVQSKRKSVIPPPEEVSRMSIVEIVTHVREYENIYALAVSVMQCYIGEPCYPYFTTPKQLYPYILHLCSEMDPSIIQQEYEIHKPKAIELTVVIQEAQIIHPKYSDFVNVYCKIWTDAGIKRQTAIRHSSIKLLWDDAFTFELKKYPTEILHIEVWSVRPGGSKQKNTGIVSLSDVTKTRDIYAESDYLVGDIIKPVHDLPCLGQDVLWPLRKGPRRVYTRGQVKMYIQLCARKDDDHIYHIQMYMQLMKMAYEKNLEFLEHTILWRNWLEILPNPALTLIQQLALQHGIGPTEQCICSWLLAATLKMKGEERMSFYFLHVLLEGLIFDIAADPAADYMEAALIHSIERFTEYIFKTLKHLHEKFNVENKDNADELYFLLKCINASEIEGNENYRKSYDIVAQEAYTWYFAVINENRFGLEEDDQDVGKVSTCLSEIVKIFLRNQILLDDIFKRAWEVNYSVISLKVLDQVVKDIIKPIIEHVVYVVQNRDKGRDVEESLKMLQLYHNVRNLINYVTIDLSASRDKLFMDDYSHWFGEDLILEWFLLCEIYTKPFIERAVAFDNMERINEMIYHGNSVPDVAAIVDEIVIDVWMKLSWEEQIFTQSALTQAIKTCVTGYVEAMYNKIGENQFFSDIKQFNVDEKLCVALSNVHAMFDHLHLTRNKILAVLSQTESDYGFIVKDQVSKVESELTMQVSEVVHEVFQQIGLRFNYYVTRMVRLGAGVTQTNALADSCTYIENTLQVLYLNLKPELFYIVLRHMWIIVVIYLSESLAGLQGSCLFLFGNTKGIYLLIYQALGQLQSIFHCDGRGLSNMELINEIYLNMKLKIESKLEIKER